MDELDGGTRQRQRLAKFEQNKDVIKEVNISIIPMAYLLVVYIVSAAIFNAIFVSCISPFPSYLFQHFVLTLNIFPFLSLHVLFLRLYVRRSPGINKLSFLLFLCYFFLAQSSKENFRIRKESFLSYLLSNKHSDLNIL